MAALLAEDKSKQAQPIPGEKAVQLPPPERSKETRLEGAEEKEVTLEVLEKEIEVLVARAESGWADFDATREQALERIRSYGGNLTAEERDRLDELRARVESRLRDLKTKALETRIASIKAAAGTAAGGEHYRGPQAAILAKLEGELATLKKEAALAEAAAVDSEEVAALKRRIESIKRAQGETAGGEHYRGAAADILKDLEAQLAAVQAKEKGAAAPIKEIKPAAGEPEIEFEEPVKEPMIEGEKGAAPEATTIAGPDTTPTAPSGATSQQEVAPPVPPEIVSPTPEAAPARAVPGAQELLAIAKIRAQSWDSPEALNAAIAQAKFVESRGLLETETTHASLIDLLKASSGRADYQRFRGPALERLAKEIGVEPAQLEAALDRQHAALEQRARDEVRREAQAGLKKVVVKGAAYVGLGMLLNRFLPGWGALTAGVRLAETWRHGSVEERKVQERLAQLEQQLAAGDLRDPKALASEFLRDLAADVAGAKRLQVDNLHPTAGEITDPRTMAGFVHRDTFQFLEERYPQLTVEQRQGLARGAAALFRMDHANATLEAKVAAQQPNAFRKLIATLDKVLGSKVLRGGETTRERMLTTAVFAAAGALAREVPIVRNILFAYTGFKAGEMAAQFITRRAGRYEVLKPVTAAALAGETVEQGVLDRARAQLLDAKFRAEKPAEYQQLREAIERHELALFNKAELATDFVDQRTAVLEQTLAAKRTMEQERQFVVNSARVAGAVAGAVLGPMAVEWLAQKFRPKEAAAAPKAEEAPRAAAAPPETPPSEEIDPKLLELAKIQKGDGLTHVLLRQLKYKPREFGFSGDPDNAADVQRWAMAEAKQIAISKGYLNPDGRITEIGLKMTEGSGFLLHPNGSIEIIGAKPLEEITYRAGRPLGFETPPAMAKTLPGGGAPMTPVEAAWAGAASEFPTAAAAEQAAQNMTGTVEDDLSKLQALAENPLSKDADVRRAVADAEAHLQAARNKLAEMRGVAGYTPRNEQLDDTIRYQKQALARMRGELVSRFGSSAVGDELLHPAGEARTKLDVDLERIKGPSGRSGAVGAGVEEAPAVPMSEAWAGVGAPTKVDLGLNRHLTIEYDVAGAPHEVRVVGWVTPGDNWEAPLRVDRLGVLQEHLRELDRLDLLSVRQAGLHNEAALLFLHQQALERLRASNGGQKDISFLEQMIRQMRDRMIQKYGNVFKEE